MSTKQPTIPSLAETTVKANPELNDAIRDYVRTYALWHGRPQAARHFGVSRQTLWRFLDRGHLGRSLPGAVVKTAGNSPESVNAATKELAAAARR